MAVRIACRACVISRMLAQHDSAASVPMSTIPTMASSVTDPGLAAAADFEGEAVDKRRASDHLVRGVDFLFALTLGQGILLFQPFWTDPLHENYIPVALALFAVYFTTFQSFIDWHLAMEKRPYLVTWDLGHWERLRERFRVFIDLTIVIVYAFMLVNATKLLADPGHDLNLFLIGFPLIFLLYTAWHILRTIRYPNADPLTLRLLVASTTGFVVLYIAYRAVEPPSWLSDQAYNNVALIVAILLTAAYRTTSWKLRSRKGAV